MALKSLKVCFKRFEMAVKSYCYTQSQVDHMMFYKHFRNGKLVILIVYVDDIIMISDDDSEIEELEK